MENPLKSMEDSQKIKNKTISVSLLKIYPKNESTNLKRQDKLISKLDSIYLIPFAM